MSLVQSFINQIGREIGRDVYNSVINNKNVNTYYGSKASTTWDQLRDFKLSSYDKLTMNNLVNLVEAVSNLSPNNFTNLEYFITMDEKIDFCKEHLDKKYLEKLEDLDNTNKENFKAFLFDHKIYIADCHDKLEEKINNYKEPNKWLRRLTNFWAILWIICGVWISTKYDSLHYNDGKEIPGNWMFWALEGILLFCCFFPSVIFREASIEDTITNHKKDREALKALEDYFTKISNIKF